MFKIIFNDRICKHKRYFLNKLKISWCEWFMVHFMYIIYNDLLECHWCIKVPLICSITDWSFFFFTCRNVQNVIFPLTLQKLLSEMLHFRFWLDLKCVTDTGTATFSFMEVLHILNIICVILLPSTARS